ncbi:helix-turn-helix domain-containing protein [Chryseobacterium sp. BLS98]|uniref:helix-turn-helix domain-containing protein n=1 Tax=Chryseobacterium sp. BLS98 TaxID=885586 RepID=UPI0013F46DAB|nr:helix-turn-helix domain-containing protein [Chryseobacterium sp. BLS98]
MQKAKKEKNNGEIAEGYILIHLNENFPNALKYLDSLSVLSKNKQTSISAAKIYTLKGNLYYKYDNLKASLNNYILGLKYAKIQNNQALIDATNINIAYLNCYMGKNEDAAKTFRHYLYNVKNSELDHNQMRVSLINCYIEINKLDSADVLIQEGLNSQFVHKNKYGINQYLYLSGRAKLKQKKYKDAIAELSKAYHYFSSVNDNTANYTLFYIGKSYAGLKNKEKAVQNFITLDANLQKTNFTSFPEIREAYTYLIDYYKEKNDKEKQLYYIERFLKVDKKLDEQFKYLSTELPKKYDTPNLLQEKESIINDLQNRKMILNISIGFLSIVLVLLTFLYFRSKKRERQHRKIAQDLINSIEMKSFKTQETEPIIIPSPAIEQTEIETEDKIVKTTPEDITQFILKELEIFESKELFLKKGITSASLAKSIKTNTTYLSEVINTQKGKNFATYLNDLRIDYALNRLIKDKKFRSYKLLAIAEELGYNNEQSFSLAFKKKTGITLSVYIKEIEKSNNSQS